MSNVEDLLLVLLLEGGSSCIEFFFFISLLLSLIYIFKLNFCVNTGQVSSNHFCLFLPHSFSHILCL